MKRNDKAINRVRTAEEKLAKFPIAKIRFWFAGSNTVDIQPHTRELQSILKSCAPDTMEWTFSDELKGEAQNDSPGNARGRNQVDSRPHEGRVTT